MKKIKTLFFTCLVILLVTSCDNEQPTPQLIKGEVSFNLESKENIHQINLNENFQGHQSNNPEVYSNYVKDENTVYVNIYFSFKSEASSDYVYVNLNYKLPEIYFKTSSNEGINSILDYKTLEFLLTDDQYLSGYNFSYTLKDKAQDHYYQSIPEGNIENQKMEVSQSKIIIDEFGNTWLHLVGGFQLDMTKFAFYGSNSEQFNIDFQLKNGEFEALFLLKGQTVIKAN